MAADVDLCLSQGKQMAGPLQNDDGLTWADIVDSNNAVETVGMETAVSNVEVVVGVQ